MAKKYQGDCAESGQVLSTETKWSGVMIEHEAVFKIDPMMLVYLDARSFEQKGTGGSNGCFGHHWWMTECYNGCSPYAEQ